MSDPKFHRFKKKKKPRKPLRAHDNGRALTFYSATLTSFTSCILQNVYSCVTFQALKQSWLCIYSRAHTHRRTSAARAICASFFWHPTLYFCSTAGEKNRSALRCRSQESSSQYRLKKTKKTTTTTTKHNKTQMHLLRGCAPLSSGNGRGQKQGAGSNESGQHCYDRSCSSRS